MVRPGYRTHDPLPARALLPRDPARRTAQPGGTRGRYERGLVPQTPPHLQRHTRRCAATFLAGTGFRHVSSSRRGEETLPSAPGRHCLCALPRCLMAKVELRAHPESFQIEPGGARAFVNVPDTGLIQVIDLAKGQAIGAFPTQGHHANFPMALDSAAHRILIVFRSPPRLLVLSDADGSAVADLNTCGDADDLFVDTKRRRVYVICGAGVIDSFEQSDNGYRRIGQVPTAPGARTGLFVPELDRLLVAVRAAGPEPAAIWVFKPAP